jgi:hypothetical protein
MNIITDYTIGDVVFTGNEYGVDKKIIKAIKVIGLKHTVNYGFDAGRSMFSYFYADDSYSWRRASEVFSNEEKATKHHEKLKTIKDTKEAKDKSEAFVKRKAELEKELAELTPEIVDIDGLEYDD